MKQSRIFLAVLALCSVVLPGCEGHKNNNTDINQIGFPLYTGCGGIIPVFWNPGGYSAKISYKEETTFSPNEFCVWTFIAPDTAGDVTIEFYENIQDKYDGIVVYTWKDSNFTSHKIPHGNSEIKIDARQFAVAFSSDIAKESNDFYFLVYVDKGDGVTIPTAYFSGQDKGEFTNPRIFEEDQYKNDQRGSVVLNGPFEAPRQIKEYSLRDLDIEENNDFVDVYVLWDYYWAPHYKFVGRFYGQESGAVVKSRVITPFPMLYLFSSDREVTGKGFTITWKIVGGGLVDTQNFLIRE